MTTVTIFSDSLGTDDTTHNDRYVRFLNACAEHIGADVNFEWTAKYSGYNVDFTDEFTNYVWNNISWYGKGPFRKSDVERAAAVLARCIEESE